MIDDIWHGRTAYIKGFWGWSPETWASIGFRDNYRDTLISKTTNPFIMVIYITIHSGEKEEMLGKIVGFYLVSHEKGHRDEFTAPEHYQRHPEKWPHAIRAIRAFSFLPEYYLDVYDFDPAIKRAAVPTAERGRELSDEQVKLLKTIPYIEVPIFGGNSVIDRTIHVPPAAKTKIKVRGGPINRSGYVVDGEPIDTPKELYSLILKGETSVFLGDAASQFQLYKIGLSMSPQTRLSAFQEALPRTLPEGRIGWSLHRSTRRDGHEPYPNFDAALVGEEAMKDYLGAHGTWLGGEFYAATKENFEKAWEIGRATALQPVERIGGKK
jgi:hypothetical protein